MIEKLKIKKAKIEDVDFIVESLIEAENNTKVLAILQFLI